MAGLAALSRQGAGSVMQRRRVPKGDHGEPQRGDVEVIKERARTMNGTMGVGFDGARSRPIQPPATMKMELMAKIERTRQELGATVEQLATKADVKTQSIGRVATAVDAG